jgi:hypothetical protein
MSGKRTKSGEDFEEEVFSDDKIDGGAAIAGSSELPDLLLQLIGEITKLETLMSELDEQEYKVVQRRYKTLLKACERLPKTFLKVKRVGFGQESTE